MLLWRGPLDRGPRESFMGLDPGTGKSLEKLLLLEEIYFLGMSTPES
jgi:hypothetical protein